MASHVAPPSRRPIRLTVNCAPATTLTSRFPWGCPTPLRSPCKPSPLFRARRSLPEIPLPVWRSPGGLAPVVILPATRSPDRANRLLVRVPHLLLALPGRLLDAGGNPSPYSGRWLTSMSWLHSRESFL